MCSSRQQRELSQLALKKARWDARLAMWKTIAVAAAVIAAVVRLLLVFRPV